MPRDLAHFCVIGTDTSEGRQRMRALKGLLGDRWHRWKATSVATHVLVPADEPIVEDVRAFLRDDISQTEWKGTLERHWSDAELSRARWYMMVFKLYQRGFAGTYLDNRFDVSKACPRCLLGARYIERLRAQVQARGRVVHQLVTREWVLNDKATHALLDAGVRGVEFLPVVGAANDRPSRLFLLQPLSVAPAVDRSSPIEQEKHCTRCKQDGWSPRPHVQLRLVYGSLPDGVDFLWTREGMGSRGTARQLAAYHTVCRRVVLASRRAYQILKRCKVQGVEFRPVELVRTGQSKE